jgi:hypothetical protein
MQQSSGTNISAALYVTVRHKQALKTVFLIDSIGLPEAHGKRRCTGCQGEWLLFFSRDPDGFLGGSVKARSAKLPGEADARRFADLTEIGYDVL